MSALPNLSGRESASNPGSPWKERGANAGNWYTCDDNGIASGETSIPERTKSGAY
jgi:hypothetical protein